MGFNTQFTPYPEQLVAVEAIPPTRTTSATATNGAAISINEYEGNLMILFHAPVAAAGTTPTLTPTVEHRIDSNDSWGAVPAAALINDDGDAAAFGVVTGAANGGLQKRGLVRSLCKAQIRVVATAAGTDTPTFVFSASIVASNKYGDQ